MTGTEENERPRPKRPPHLTKKTRDLWDAITARYDLRDDEMSLLEDACRVLDKVDELERIMRADGLTLIGPRGDVVTHPALRESRQQRNLLVSIWKRLGLPDDVEAEGSTGASRAAAAAETRSAKAAKAAAARWSTAHGSAAL